MIKKRILLYFILILLYHLPAGAEPPALEKLSEYIFNINRFNTVNPQEKVYLHFDNTGYYIGDTLWFSAYIVSAENIRPTSLSKILHVELLTPDGEIADRRKLKITGGRCNGEFPLEIKYRSGFYEVRAYTRSMLNFGEDCIFSRVFPVYSEPETEGVYSEKHMESGWRADYQREKKEKEKEVNLSFYPEGGHAVSGLACRIAFKATGKNGEYIDVSGTLYNRSGHAVANFSSLHQGTGFFDLVPESTEYHAVVEYNGKKYNFAFPGILSSGYSLQVKNPAEEILELHIQKTPSIASDTIGVSVSCRGKVYAFESIALTGHDPYILYIPREKLPQGCLQITVFDRDGNVYAERLAFNVKKGEYFSVEVKTDKESYRSFEAVKMEISITGTTGRPVETGFSLSVRDSGTELHTAYQDNILTGLLLSSDIKGYIYNPMQYFTDTDSLTRLKLDLLMLVQGWRRYNWQQQAGVLPFEAKHYAEEGLPVSGKVLSYSGKDVKPGVDVTLWMMKGRDSYQGRGTTDTGGRFHFLLPDSAAIYDRWLLGLQASEKGKRKDYRITLDRTFSPRGRSYTYYDSYVKDTVVVFTDENADMRPSIEEMQLLPGVVVKTKRKRGMLRPDIVLNVEREINSLADRGEKYPLNVRDYLDKYVPAFDVQKRTFRKEPVYFCYRYKREKTEGTISSILDIDIINVSRIDIYHTHKHAWTEIASSGRCFERRANRPAVFILVHLYDDGFHETYQKGIRYTPFYGYSQVKEFYHADNSGRILGETDFRRTLYWNPDIRTDKEGRAAIGFYNNSICRRMTVSAEGLTAEGIPVILENNNSINK